MLNPLVKECNIVNYLIREYYRSSLNFDLKLKSIQELSWSQQEHFIRATIKNPLLEKYPVKPKFSKLFLKKLIHFLEQSQDVHDELYSHLCMTMECDDSDPFCYRHYIIGNDLNDIVTIRETNNMVVNGTTGMRTWEASIMLSDWALCNIEAFKKKRVLELGSGVGFTGITIGKFCQTQSMLLSDCHEDVLQAIEKNIAINFSSWHFQKSSESTIFTNNDQSIGVMALDWNEIKNLPTEVNPDIIIGADIVYDPTILQPLCKVLQNFVQKNENVKIFIAGIIRNEETFNSFLQCLDLSNLHYQQLAPARNVYMEWDCGMRRYLLQINKNI